MRDECPPRFMNCVIEVDSSRLDVQETSTLETAHGSYLPAWAAAA
jgi:hypothetical protein